MHRPAPIVVQLALVLLAAATAARGGDVYKCTTPSGDIAYQDHPCANGATETTMHLLPPPAPPEQAPAADDANTAPADAPPPPPPAAPPDDNVATPPPQMFLCTRAEDGTRYMSDDGAPVQRQVPAGIIGVPAKGLGDTGVSAPGVRRIPVDPSPAASAAGNYVTVQDQCVPASTQMTCDYLRGEYDTTKSKLRRAFKDERAVLEPKLADLETRLAGC